MKLSKEQKDIKEVFESGKNIAINAVAGSGKTTTLLNLLNENKHSYFVAFNKSIATELNNKIKIVNAEAKTLHSIGLRTILNNSKRKNIIINKTKKYYLLNKYTPVEKEFLSVLIDAARLFNDFDFESLRKNKFVKIKLEDSYKDIWENFKDLWFENYKGKKVVIDFIDMIFVPVYFKMNVNLNLDVLFIDEAQDLNFINHLLLDKIERKQFVSVGDTRQSIYGFSGAYPESFNMFLKKDNTELLPLTTCYRCSRKIIDEANKVYNVMKYGNDNIGQVDIIKNIENIKENSLIVCRNTYDLLILFFALLKINKSVSIKGKDILSNIINFLNYRKYKSVNDIIEELKEEDEEEKIELLNIIILLKKIFFTNNTEKLLFNLYSIINKNSKIVLSTIHKAKGLESDTVYFLNEYLIPSKHATTKEDLEQEKNLRYVAITRAKNNLFYLNY